MNRIMILCIVIFFGALNLCAQGSEIGKASWYSRESAQREGTSGDWTASGERFFENDMTCAMRSRDYGGRYRVTNLATGKSVVVKHNDFGPARKLYEQGRIIDLSKKSFSKIADLKKGIIRVSVVKVL